MDRLQAMTTFVAVVETGGFASAARKLDLSPPVVTRAVAELESRLGLRLLTRTTRIVRVTEAGARYADDCRRILAEIDEAEQAAQGEHQAPKGTLTITAPVMFGHLYVTPLLARYLLQWPQLDANCLFLDRVVNLLEEGVDVAVRIGELPDSSLHAARVGRVRRVLVASPAYAQAHGLPAHPRDLVDHALISAAGLAAQPEWQFGIGEQAFSQRVQPRMRSTSNESGHRGRHRGPGHRPPAQLPGRGAPAVRRAGARAGSPRDRRPADPCGAPWGTPGHAAGAGLHRPGGGRPADRSFPAMSAGPGQRSRSMVSSPPAAGRAQHSSTSPSPGCQAVGSA